MRHRITYSNCIVTLGALSISGLLHGRTSISEVIANGKDSRESEQSGKSFEDFHSSMMATAVNMVQDGSKSEGSPAIRLRKPTPEDLNRFNECLAADPDHAKQGIEAWTAEPGEFMVFYDRAGNRVWVRLERVLRVHFQHDPDTPRKELVSLIYKGMAWVIGSARQKQFEEVIFQSTAPRLVAFCQKLFGFTPTKNDYSVRTT